MTQPETSDIDGIISAEDLIEVSSGGLRFIPNDTPTIAQQLWGLYCSDCIRLKIQIEAALSLIIQKMDPSKKSFEHLNWNTRSWKFPMANGTSNWILPQVSGLNIQKSSVLPYERKSQRELFKMGETILDQKFAKRLEIKREIIGLS